MTNNNTITSLLWSFSINRSTLDYFISISNPWWYLCHFRRIVCTPLKWQQVLWHMKSWENMWTLPSTTFPPYKPNYNVITTLLTKVNFTKFSHVCYGFQRHPVDWFHWLLLHWDPGPYPEGPIITECSNWWNATILGQMGTTLKWGINVE